MKGAARQRRHSGHVPVLSRFLPEVGSRDIRDRTFPFLGNVPIVPIPPRALTRADASLFQNGSPAMGRRA
jgi:hypothetical protein